MAMANELPSLDKAGADAATGTTQLLERAVLLLLFAGLVIGVLAVLRPSPPQSCSARSWPLPRGRCAISCSDAGCSAGWTPRCCCSSRSPSLSCP